MRRITFFAWVLCLLTASAMADQVTLKNGDRLTGTIVKSDAKTLLIKTTFAGDVNVQWDAVSGIESAEPLHLALKDGQTIVGTVTTSDSKFDVATKDTGPVAAPIDTVVAVRNDVEQKSYDEQIERLRHPHLHGFLERGAGHGLEPDAGKFRIADVLAGGESRARHRA